MRNGFELAQFAFQKITLRSWLCVFQFSYDAGSLRVQILVKDVGLWASSHGTLHSLRELGGSATGVLIIDRSNSAVRWWN
ncbi:hypothetical protein AC630_19605 [Bradyrhizobium sp. AS23.2]|nr:hypothetical protein AC630_19605 [Bradyrhizobium sp. AS23.2]